jgi:uncharacterized protein (TIGR03437 family)
LSSAVARAPGLPGSGIAQGSIFSIYGSGLGPASWVQVNKFPLQTTLGGTSVTVTVHGAQVSAIVLGTDGNQVNALLPSNTPVGNGTFTVTHDNQTSAPASIQVVASAFNIYAFNQQGNGQAIATDVNYQLNTIIHVFHPGDYVVLWGTGLGAINGNDADAPPIGNLPTPIAVYVGDTTANVTYQGRSGCCSGLDQIIFQVPSGITGCYVPVAVEAGGITGNIGNYATIAVAQSGEICSDSVMGQDVVSQLAAGHAVKFGYIRLISWIANYVVGGGGGQSNEDFGYATFSEYTPATAGLAQYGVSRAYCAAVDCSFGCGAVMSNTGDLSDSSPAQLDAGTVSVQSAPAITLAQQSPSGFYASLLSQNGRFLWGGLTYPVVGTGGTGVGGFSVSDVAGAGTGIKLTGISNSQTVPLASDLTVQWTTDSSDQQDGDVTIYAQSGNDSQFGFVQCTAAASAHKFTIPARVLAALPVSGTGGTGLNAYPKGWIQIGQYNTPTSFSATGLTRGIITDIFYNGLGVYFK